VSNTSGFVQELVFRIFMAPVKDQTGRNFSLREQRQLMIEMDKFVQKGNSYNFTGETELCKYVPQFTASMNETRIDLALGRTLRSGL
jgi:hypothetical protein